MAALFVAALFWRSGDAYLPLLGCVVSTGALIVVLRALKVQDYRWALVFAGIAVFFNPIVPFSTASDNVHLVTLLSSIVIFGAALISLRRDRLHSIPSITGEHATRESL
jgi:hypothetical protein